MKARGIGVGAAVVAIGILATPCVVRAFGVLEVGPDDPPIQPQLDTVTVSLENEGRVRYLMTGHLVTSKGPVALSAEGWFDPVARRAVDTFVVGTLNFNSRASCITDPWLASQVVCSDVNVNPPLPKVIAQPSSPPSAGFLNDPDRAMLVAAYRKELDRQNALKTAKQKRLRSQMVIPPTPTRSVLASAAGLKNAGGVGLGAGSPKSQPAVTPMSTPVYPPYGAVYTGGNPPVTMSASQAPLSVSITVQNTSSQTWTSGGNFHLSYHWYQGGAQLVRDGERTFMPVNVTPGRTVNLSATVKP
ncbi:MAG: hypothetical protein WCC53_01655, partial [Thermoanaerobaculia bacterium]